MTPEALKPDGREWKGGEEVWYENARSGEKFASGSYRWRWGAYVAVSGLEVAAYPDGSGDKGPQWHVSFSRAPDVSSLPPGWRERLAAGAKPAEVAPGHRLTDSELGVVRRMFFGTLERQAEEDNHHPGVARHLWLPVDPARRVDCECKATEIVVVDADGYTWTNPADGHGPCRGCELARVTGRPCPLHPRGPTP